MSFKNGRSGDLHPDRKMRFGSKSQLKPKKSVAEFIIEMMRARPNDPRAGEWADELLKHRGRSMLPLDVKAVLERHGR